MHNVKLPDSKQTKDIVFVVIGIAVIVLVIVFAKNILKLFGAAGQGLGLSNSPDKQEVNQIFESGKFPLFSSAFDEMNRRAPAGAPLKKTDYLDTLIADIKDARGFLFDDDEKILGVFSGGVNTQFQVAQLAKQFYTRTENDLFDFLRKDDTLFSQGFAAPTVKKIIDIVKSKPLYK